MEIKTLEYNILQYDSLQIDTSLISINLSDIMENLRSCLPFSKTSILAVPLLNEPDKKIIISAAHENSDIEFPPTANSVSLQVIEGVLVFRTRKESVTLNPGMILTVSEKKKFRIKAMENALFLVTLEFAIQKINTGLN
ncbi:MAG: hypothetical protein LC649_07360 [Bacteroidales bacterium]|nr:hypothetical protein [Bacteroidales bacterium]